MKKIPALFQPEMVDALLREIQAPGTGKTQTRRVAYKPGGPPGDPKFYYGKATEWTKVKPGDVLWVRERHWRFGQWIQEGQEDDLRWRFLTNGPSAPEAPFLNISFNKPPGEKLKRTMIGMHQRPSIFLPQEFSRISLVVTAARIEKLQAITDADCVAEGLLRAERPSQIDGGLMVFPDPARRHLTSTPRAGYRQLWESINGADSWEENPEVVVTTFAPVMVNVGQVASDLVHYHRTRAA